MNRSKRRIGDDGRMKEEEDELLNRLYGVDHAESVRPSDAEPPKPPAARSAPAVKRPAVRALWLDTDPLRWRSVGRADMGGRIGDFAVAEKDPYTIYVAVGTGGVLKAASGGSTWQGVFDKRPVAS